MASPPRPPRPARSASGDPLLGEVRWRLFRQEDMPARLRRLRRMEEVAASERRRNGHPPKTAPEGR